MDTNRFADAWAGFKGRLWKEEVNTRDFIQNNYNYGADYRNFRQKKELKAEFLIWKLK